MGLGCELEFVRSCWQFEHLLVFKLLGLRSRVFFNSVNQHLEAFRGGQVLSSELDFHGAPLRVDHFEVPGQRNAQARRQLRKLEPACICMPLCGLAFALQQRSF